MQVLVGGLKPNLKLVIIVFLPIQFFEIFSERCQLNIKFENVLWRWRWFGFQIKIRFSKGFNPIVSLLLCDWTTNSSLLWFLFMHTYKVSENYRFAHFQTPQFFLHTKDEMIIFVTYLVLKQSKNVGVSKVQLFWEVHKNLKKLTLVLTLLNKNSCFFKTSGRFFPILWPSHNVITLIGNHVLYSHVSKH